MGNNIVVFRLKRLWEVEGRTVNLYEEIKSGRKTSEWRDASPYWLRRLLTNRLTKEGLKYVLQVRGYNPQELTTLLKVHRAWFTVGYPKGNIPRLEADITALIYHLRHLTALSSLQASIASRQSGQLEIKIASVVEIAALHTWNFNSFPYGKKELEKFQKLKNEQVTKQKSKQG